MEGLKLCPHCSEDFLDSEFDIHRIGCEVKQIREKFNQAQQQQKELLEKIYANELKKQEILQQRQQYQEEMSIQLQDKFKIEMERDRLIRERMELQFQREKLINEKRRMEQLNTRFKLERDRLLIENKKIMIQILQLTILMQNSTNEASKGMSQEQIDQFPTIIYQENEFNKLSLTEQDENSQKCSICLEHFENLDNLKFLGCIHKFHQNCCDKWLEIDSRCPCCKQDMIEFLEKQEEFNQTDYNQNQNQDNQEQEEYNNQNQKKDFFQ